LAQQLPATPHFLASLAQLPATLHPAPFAPHSHLPLVAQPHLQGHAAPFALQSHLPVVAQPQSQGHAAALSEQRESQPSGAATPASRLANVDAAAHTVTIATKAIMLSLRTLDRMIRYPLG
jgi:hypothetical protein